jgi:HD-like signal output (HDOD) protein/ActR/RegA family two-component response regulator
VIRVLFVDDEPLVLRALGRMAHGLRGECDAAFASSGEAALEMMGTTSYDVLVSDMRMPGMDGAAVLAQAERRFPQTARIILSGYSQYEAALRALPVCHRFLAKPLRAEELQSVLLRTVSLHKLLSDPRMRELVGGAKDLPARPQVYFQLRGALANAASSMRTIGRIVERDAGITGRLLRTVNNAFFAPASRITSAQQAATQLGTETLTGVVLSLECFGNFEDTLAQCQLDSASLERKAYLAATIASSLLRDETSQKDAFLGALLHDAGLLLTAARQPALVTEAVKRARHDKTPLHVAERALWNTTHAEVGGYLLGLWGIPYPVIEAVARCHSPELHVGPELDVASAVYLAVVLADAAMSGELSAVQIDPDFLARFNLASRLGELLKKVERLLGASEPPEDNVSVAARVP